MKKLLLLIFILTAGFAAIAQFSPNVGNRHTSIKVYRIDGATSNSQYLAITPSGTYGKWINSANGLIDGASQGSYHTYDTAIVFINRYNPISRIDLYNLSVIGNINFPNRLVHELDGFITLGRLDIQADTINFGAENSYELVGTGSYPKLRSFDYVNLGAEFNNNSFYGLQLFTDTGEVRGLENIKKIIGYQSSPGQQGLTLNAVAAADNADSTLYLSLDTLASYLTISSVYESNPNKTRKWDITVKNGRAGYVGFNIYNYWAKEPGGLDTIKVDYVPKRLVQYLRVQGTTANQNGACYYDLDLDTVNGGNFYNVVADTLELSHIKFNSYILMSTMQNTNYISFPDSMDYLDVATYAHPETFNLDSLFYNARYVDLTSFDADSFIFNDVTIDHLYMASCDVAKGDTIYIPSTNIRKMELLNFNEPVKLAPYYDWIDIYHSAGVGGTGLKEIPVGDTLKWLNLQGSSNSFSKFRLADYALDTLDGVNFLNVDTFDINTGLDFYRGDTTATVSLQISNSDSIIFENSLCKQPIDLIIVNPDQTKQDTFNLSNYYHLNSIKLDGVGSLNWTTLMPTSHIDSIISIDLTDIIPHDSILDYSTWKVLDYKIVRTDGGDFKLKLPTDSIDDDLVQIYIYDCDFDTLDFSYYKNFLNGTSGGQFVTVTGLDSLEYLKFPKNFTPYRIYYQGNKVYVNAFNHPVLSDRSNAWYDFRGGVLDAAAVNKFLYDLDINAVSGYSGRRIYMNTGCQPPDNSSGGVDGVAAKNSLITKGFTVYTL